MGEKDTWNTFDIVENRNNWSLASDGELLKHLQQLSQKLVDKSQSTLNLLKSFENEVNQTCTKVSNIDNHFKSLSDTQFIESKVQDSPEIEINDVTHDATPSIDQPTKHEDISLKLKEAVKNGIKVLDTHYDIIAVTDSDSESEEPQEILLKARNSYISRRLPYIIGSEEFTNYDHLGLVYTTSEDEEDEESDEELLPSIVPPTTKIEIESHLAKTEVIRVSSSDSEDGEESVPCINFAERSNVEELEKPSINIPQTKNLQAHHSFADHLNATLQNYGAKSFINDASQVGDIFSPPPFPSKDSVDSSSDDEKNDSSDDVNTKDNPRKIGHSVSTSNIISDNGDVGDAIKNSKDKIDSFLRESPMMTKGKLTKLPSSSSAHESSSSQQPSQFVKSSVSSTLVSPQKQVMNRIGDELNAKLKIPPRRVSSSDDSESDPEVISAISQPKLSSTDSVVSTSLDKTITNSLGKETKTTDIFAGTPSKPTEPNSDIFATSTETTLQKPKSKKTLALFDDDDEDDDLDDLFKSKKPSNENKRISTTSLFEAESRNSNLQEKSTPTLGTNIINSSADHKIALFDSDDSDSEDDIFAMINSQKRTNSKKLDEKNESKVIEVKNETCTISNDDRNNDASGEENEINRQVSKDDESRNSTTFDSQNVAAIIMQTSGSIFDDVSEYRADVFGEERQRAETRSRNDDSNTKPVVRATLGLFEENNDTTKMSSKNAENDHGTNNENETNVIAGEKVIQSTCSDEGKMSDDKISDEKDGNLLGKSIEEKPKEAIAECRPKPGKLVGRGLNINVNALLPGSRWSSKSKENDSVVVDQRQTAKENLIESTIGLKSEDVSKLAPEQSTSNITSVMKERVKISTKRRPPSRRARISNISSQDPFLNDIIAEDGDQKTSELKKDVIDDTNETNKPLEFPSSVERNRSVISEQDHSKVNVFPSREERKKTNFDELFQSDDDDEEVQNEENLSGKIDKILSFPPSKSVNTEPATSVLPSITSSAKRMEYKPPLNGNSASVLTGFIKDRNQLSQRQPPARKVDVAESNFEENIPSSKSTDVDSKPIEPLVKSTTMIDDIFSSSNVVSPSSTSKKIDFKKLFEESDEEDDLFADVLSKSITSQGGIQPRTLDVVEKPNASVEDSIITETDLPNYLAQASKPKDSTIEPVSVVSSKSEERLQPSLFASRDVNSSDATKTEIVATKKQSAGFIPKHSKDLFADDDDNDDEDTDNLFPKSPVKAASPLFVKPATKIEKMKNDVGRKPTSNIEINDSKKIDLFADDDDDLFSAPKKKFLAKSASKKTSLFDDDDDSDDLFGSKKTSAKSSNSSKKN